MQLSGEDSTVNNEIGTELVLEHADKSKNYNTYGVETQLPVLD